MIDNAKLEGVPERITTPIIMDKANQPIPIYEGVFTLRKDKHLFAAVNGSLKFHWFPTPSVRFTGFAEDDSAIEALEYVAEDNVFEIVIDEVKFGEGAITSFTLDNNLKLEGTILSKAIEGDRSIPVSKIGFIIPNLREFFGHTTKEITNTGSVNLSYTRITFENDEYVISIDKLNDFKDLHKSLKSEGGYVALYAGEIAKRKGNITYKESLHTINGFRVFLNFLNGRRTSPLFLQGIHEDKITWSDFSSYSLDQYKYVQSWPAHFSVEGFNEMWQNFSKIWDTEDGKDFLTSAIHWYNEANSSSRFPEGGIIIAQTALELLYNWLLIQKRKLLIGKDASSITAANKIRLLLSQLEVDFDIPDDLVNLQNLKSLLSIEDAPDAFVQIRNSLVHSQEEKRKQVIKMNPAVKDEALKLGVWYIELSLLYILGFNHNYFNRCSNAQFAGSGEMYVPWSKLTEINPLLES